MRLATFNVLHGRSLTDGRVDGDRYTAVISALDVDVLGLQEVDQGQRRSGELDLTALAGRALGASAYRFAAAVVGTPGERFRALDHDDDGVGGPLYGVGLVSRWPARAWHITRLPPAPVRSPTHVPGAGGRLMLLGDEPRVVLAAVLETPYGELTAATTHLSFAPGWNAWQLRQTVRVLRRLPAPRILLGDLNLPARLAAAVSRWRALARMATYPTARPRVQFDHVLLDPRGMAALPPVTRVAAPLTPISDHRPLVVQLGGSERTVP